MKSLIKICIQKSCLNFGSRQLWTKIQYNTSSVRSQFAILTKLNILHAYIHNWPLQTFSEDYGLVSTTHVMCVKWRDLRMLRALILCKSGGTYNLMSTPIDRFLRNFFNAILFTLRVFAIYLLRRNRRNIFFIFRFDA